MPIDMTPALAAALALGVAAGPLGCFIVWRRMAYFGDGLAHSALLGVAIGLFFGLGAQIGIVLVGILFTLGFSLLQVQKFLPNDTLLGLLAHAAMAGGLIGFALVGSTAGDLHDILTGTLAKTDWPQARNIALGCGFTLIVLLRFWSALVQSTAHAELAQVGGVAVQAVTLILTLLLGVFVALSVQSVGILLITSTLIIPAASARLFSTSPEMMAVSAAALAALGAIFGVSAAQSYALPLAPTIIGAHIISFSLCLIWRAARRD